MISQITPHITPLQLDTWTLAPIGGAVVADAIAHSIPGLNILFSLLAEPVGAACGVAYMMSLVLSAPAVDPKTLAPQVRACPLFVMRFLWVLLCWGYWMFAGAW